MKAKGNFNRGNQGGARGGHVAKAAQTNAPKNNFKKGPSQAPSSYGSKTQPNKPQNLSVARGGPVHHNGSGRSKMAAPASSEDEETMQQEDSDVSVSDEDNSESQEGSCTDSEDNHCGTDSEEDSDPQSDSNNASEDDQVVGSDEEIDSDAVSEQDSDNSSDDGTEQDEEGSEEDSDQVSEDNEEGSEEDSEDDQEEQGASEQDSEASEENSEDETDTEAKISKKRQIVSKPSNLRETPSGQSNECTVFVGNLPYSIEEGRLRQLFTSCGPIRQVRLVRDFKTKKCKGIAYIDFSSKEAHDKAVQSMNGHDVDGRQIRVDAAATTKSFMNKSKKDACPILFVGNLAYTVTEKKLQKIFGAFGNVVSVRIPQNNGQSRGYAYVQFSSTEEAKKAMAVPRFEIDQRIIRLDYDAPNKTPSHPSTTQDSGNSSSHNDKKRPPKNDKPLRPFKKSKQ